MAKVMAKPKEKPVKKKQTLGMSSRWYKYDLHSKC